MSAGRPPPRRDQDHARRLRDDLAAAGYTVAGIQERLGPVATAALDREQPLPADLATRAAVDPVGLLLRLFVLGRPVPRAAVQQVLPATGGAGLLHLGLATTSAGDVVRATVDLRPHAADTGQWWVASDLTELATGQPLSPDHVLGLGGASTTLASWLPRPAAARALDLGTGCGVQSLHLATHAEAVVATDTSARALAFAGLNADLNDLSLDLRQGSLFEPVGREVFDLVASNPPFVITPRVPGVPVYEYRDGGLTGDTLVRGLVRSVAAHLAPGGIATLLANWEIPAGATWQHQLGSWLDGTGLDAFVVQRDVQDPAQYAELWARDAGHLPGLPGYDDLYAAWLTDFAGRGVEAVGFGVVTLQQPLSTRPAWRDLVEHSGPVGPGIGECVLRRVRALTWLAEHGDADVLAARWRCADDVTQERHYRPGEDDPRVIVLRQGGGLRRAAQVGTVMAGLVDASDGQLPAAAVLDAIAQLTDRDPGPVRAEALAQLRDLVADGVVELAAG